MAKNKSSYWQSLRLTGNQGLIHHTHDQLPRLFNLPAEVKEDCNMIHSASFLGYTRLGAETTASQTDLREVSGVYYSTGGMIFPH